MLVASASFSVRAGSIRLVCLRECATASDAQPIAAQRHGTKSVRLPDGTTSVRLRDGSDETKEVATRQEIRWQRV